MITLLTGDNSFEIERALNDIQASFNGDAEKIEGSELEARDLPSLLMGGTLFADKRLVIIKNLSENKTLWAAFGELAEKVSDDIHIVLVETKPDKRTKAYKDIVKRATVTEFKLWTEKDVGRAEQWVASEASAHGIVIDKNCIRMLVARAGVNQWQLSHALQKLSVFDKITPELIEDSIEPQPSENVFNLFETAIKGDTEGVQRMVASLRLSEEPHRLFGLLSGQAYQLTAVTVAPNGANVSKDFAIHPFVQSKLSPYAKRLGKSGVRRIINILADADENIKTSGVDPWLIIETALLRIAH